MDFGRSLFQLIMESTLAADLADPSGKLVTAGWLMSGDWKAARAMARHHKVCVIDAEHGAITVNDASFVWPRAARAATKIHRVL